MKNSNKNPLHYQGDVAKLRCHGVYVQANGITQDDVVLAVKRFLASTMGAEEEPGGAGVDSADLKKRDLIGIAVLPPAPDVDGTDWIGIYDSRRLSSWDEELRQALNAYLSVPTFSFDILPENRFTSIGESCYSYGDGFTGIARKSTNTREKTLYEADRFPYPFFTPTDPVEGIVWLRFRLDGEILGWMLELKEFWLPERQEVRRRLIDGEPLDSPPHPQRDIEPLLVVYASNPTKLTIEQAERLACAGAVHPALIDRLNKLAYKVHDSNIPMALAIYRAMLAVPPPKKGPARSAWLQAANNALVITNMAKLYAESAELADRVIQYVRENPYIAHSAACSYAATGRCDDAFEQVKLAVELNYEHLDRLRADANLGVLLDRAVFEKTH